MRKILITIFGIVCFFSITEVNALSGSATLSCDKSVVNVGDIITCTLKGNASDGSVTSMSGQVELGSNLALNGISTSNIWQGNGDGGKILLYTDVGKGGGFDIATFTVKVNGPVDGGFIKISDLIFYDDEYNPSNINVGQSSVRSASTNNNLASLSLSNATINFSKDVTVYNVNSNESSTVISATAEDGRARVDGAGNKTINYGNNQFNVVVTSEAGIAKTYTINVYKEDKRSKTNTLKSIKINGVDYDVKTETHTINVGNEIDKVTISSALSDDSTSKYVDGFGNRTVNLNEGDNQVLIKVRAENESVRTYTFNIVRAAKNPENQNVNIKSLTIKNHDNFKFTPGMFDYQLLLGDNENRLAITVELENANATYKIENNNDLKDDDIVVIKVTSEDNTVTQDYRIKIIKSSNVDETEDGDSTVEDNTDDRAEKSGSLLIPVIVFIVGLVAFIIALIYRKKQSSKKEEEVI